MPSGEERLLLVTTEEQEVFVTDCRQLYLDTTAKLGHTPKVDTELIVVGKLPAKKYLQVCKSALATQGAVMIVAKGPEVAKLVSVVEQAKQNTKGRVAQLNKLFRQPSLINPSYAATNSMKNVQIFFGDDTDSNISASSVLKEIKGHKVYDVPCMAVLLATGDKISSSGLDGWTVQVKGQ